MGSMGRTFLRKLHGIQSVDSCGIASKKLRMKQRRKQNGGNRAPPVREATPLSPHKKLSPQTLAAPKISTCCRTQSSKKDELKTPQKPIFPAVSRKKEMSTWSLFLQQNKMAEEDLAKF